MKMRFFIPLLLSCLLISGRSHAQGRMDFDSAVKAIRSVSDDSLRMESYYTLERRMLNEYPKDALKVIDMIMEEARQRGNENEIGRAFYTYGTYYHKIGNYSSSTSNNLEALRLFEKTGNH